jgi:hypothetical protein
LTFRTGVYTAATVMRLLLESGKELEYLNLGPNSHRSSQSRIYEDFSDIMDCIEEHSPNLRYIQIYASSHHEAVDEATIESLRKSCLSLAEDPIPRHRPVPLTMRSVQLQLGQREREMYRVVKANPVPTILILCMIHLGGWPSSNWRYSFMDDNDSDRIVTLSAWEEYIHR